MICSFKNDYSECAHPSILKAISESNFIQQEGYGYDDYSKKAKELLKEKINKQDIDIHFVSGGTQANLVTISSMLKPFESVIASESGHIATREAGSIESTGHKVNTVKTEDGKLTEYDIQSVLEIHTDEHMVKPKLVYISNSTEIGSVYSKNELEKLHNFCIKNNLFLYLDGARIGSAIAASDLTLSDVSRLTDAFYIGGTKNGAFIGEAIVINNDSLKENFRYCIKQKGALLAKGRLIGIQFLKLFENDLYFQLAGYANRMANKIAEAIKEKGYEFLSKPVSNQIFPILPDSVIKELNKNFDFYVWQRIDSEFCAVRIVTSWATKEEYVNKFISYLKQI